MLEPSDRVRLIKEISNRLEAEEWPLLDLTLSQFSLPTSSIWSDSSKSAYVIEMIKNAADDALVGLARHVGFDPDPKRPQVEPEFWFPGRFRLFLSHLAKFRAEAAAVQEVLTSFEISSFVAHSDIEPTAEWQNSIESALATADAIAALLREGFHQSNWTDQELGYGMGRNLLIVAISFGHAPYGFMGRFQALNGSDSTPANLAQNIFAILRKNKQTKKRMTEALMSGLERAGSFAQAKLMACHLEDSTYWDGSLSERCRRVLESNSQVTGAWKVPERLERILAKWANG